MEGMKDLITNFKERVSNPLVFSFICSWLFINWPITVGLLWYDPWQIERHGYKTIFELIEKNVNPIHCFWFPLLIGAVYTGIMPIIRNLINALHSWATTWGESWNLKIKKEMKIPYEKYIRLRNDYDKRSKILEEIIQIETTIKEEYANAKTEMLEAQKKVAEFQTIVNSQDDIIRKLNEIRLLEGYWTYTNSNDLTTIANGGDTIYIEGDRLYPSGQPISEPIQIML
jgi:hypothetical protein